MSKKELSWLQMRLSKDELVLIEDVEVKAPADFLGCNPNEPSDLH